MHDEAVLQVLDDVARRFMTLNEGTQFRSAQTPAELEAVYRLRYQTVIEKGWAEPEDYPDGMERDKYDDNYTLQLMALSGESLVGTGRVVLPAPDRSLPAEDFFGIVIEPHKQVTDMGRVAVNLAYQSAQHQIFLGLVGMSWLTTREQGLFDMCGVVSSAMFRLYRMVGFEVTMLAPFQPYWGEERAPFQLDRERSAESFRTRTDLFWKRLASAR